MKLNKYIDHTLLKPEATKSAIEQLCLEAKEHQFASVCVNPTWVATAKSLLDQTNVKVCTVIGFPLGANTSATKAFEAKDAIAHGATEIDMVLNIGQLKDKQDAAVRSDIEQVVLAAAPHTVKVILETCLLTDEEIVRACNLVVAAKAHFVKTSTGFSTGGATLEVVELMKATVGDQAEVKASGGVRTIADAQAMIEVGATRIGTSNGVAILQGTVTKEGY